tara:strand:- start:494 stop:637 length:144 start_codon:yes stop_codon:yes gene_type:complete
VITLGKNIANITDVIKRIGTRIQELLWSNDVAFFSVVESFANERDIL